jgi:hypothetical protein
LPDDSSMYATKLARSARLRDIIFHDQSCNPYCCSYEGDLMHALCCPHNGRRISNTSELLQQWDHILMNTGSWDQGGGCGWGVYAACQGVSQPHWYAPTQAEDSAENYKRHHEYFWHKRPGQNRPQITFLLFAPSHSASAKIVGCCSYPTGPSLLYSPLGAHRSHMPVSRLALCSVVPTPGQFLPYSLKLALNKGCAYSHHPLPAHWV